MGFNIFKKEEEVEQKTSVADKYQISRKTAAHARPAREKAGTVRVSGSSKQANVLMSKEEQEEIKRRNRAESDLRDAVAAGLLKDNAAYNKLRRIWYVLLVVGLAMIAVSYIALQYQTPDTTTWANYVSIGSLILAYAGIFTAFFFDLSKIRPLRKDTYARVSRMGLKHVEALALEQTKKAEAEGKKANK